MGTYEVIKSLCEKRGIPVTKLEEQLGFGRGSIGKLRNGKTSVERLQKVADFFEVTLDYLLTGEEPSFSDKFFSGTCFESYLKSIGWEVSFTNYEEGMPCDKCRLDLEPDDDHPFGKTTSDLCEHCLKDDNHYVISNGIVSVNVSKKEFFDFENAIRNECLKKIMGFFNTSIGKGFIDNVPNQNEKGINIDIDKSQVG